MKKRVVSLLLCLIMALSLIPTAAFAAEASSQDDGISLTSIRPDDQRYYTYEFYNGSTLISTQTVKEDDTLYEPPVTAPAGKTFTGWSPEVTFGKVSDVTETKTIRVDAKFEDGYHVTFLTTDGSVLCTDTVTPNGTLTDLPDEVKNYQPAGKRVTAWKNGGVEFTTSTVVTGDITLTPECVDCYWVTFDTQGGSGVASQYVDQGKTLTLANVTDPTRTGYTFKGWSLTQNGETVASVIPSADTTLYAVWEASGVKYTVAYWGENANDDKFETFLGYEEKYASTGRSVSGGATLPTSITNRNYFTYKDSDTATVKADGSTVINVRCTRNKYKVTFDLGRSRSNAMTVAGKRYTGGQNAEKYTLTAKFEQNIEDLWPTASNFNSGNEFSGWSIDGVRVVSTSKRVTMTADLCASDGKTARANYDAYCLDHLYYMFESFDQTSPVNGNNRIKYNGKYYDKSTVYSQNVNSEGITWNQKSITGMTANGTDTKVLERGFLAYPTERNVFLYYDRLSYKLTWNNYGSTTTDTLKYGAQLANKGTPARPAGFSENATFKGWYTVPVAQITDTTVPFDFAGKTMPASNMTLFAYWVEAQIEVTFIVGNRSFKANIPYGTKANSADAYATAITAISTSGKTLLKWVNNTTGSAVDVNQQLYTETTLRAVFKGDTHKVTYVVTPGTGSVTDDRSYEYDALAVVKSGSDITLPAGKVFLGWTTVAGGTTVTKYPGSTVQMKDQDITLYAVYGDKASTVQLTYKANGGNGADITRTDIPNNSKVTLLGADTFTRPDYEFTGWNTQADGKGTSFAADASARVDNLGSGNVLYAQWKQLTGSLTIKKEVEGLSGTAVPDSFNFEVSDSNNTQIATVYATDNWTTTLTDLTPGRYRVTEKNTDAQVNGYDLEVIYSNNGEANVTAGATPTVTVINKYTKINRYESNVTPATLTITKVDKDNNNTKLTGAVFQLRDKDGKVYGEFAEDGNGVYTISNIKVEEVTRLYLYETTAPAGYETPTDAVAEFEAKLETSGTEWKNTNNNPNGAWVTTGKTMIRKIDVQQFDFRCTIEITNNKLFGDAVVNPASLTVIKTDAKDGSLLKGAKFVLIAEDKSEFPATTDKDGKAVFAGLTKGTYTLKEVTAPEGYQATDKIWTITVSDDAQTAGYVLKDGKFVKTVTCKVDDVKDVVANGSITITNVKATGTVTINKVLKGLNATDFEDGFAFDIKDASGKVVATVEKVFPGMAQPATVTLVPGAYTIVEKSADVKDYDLTTEYDKETFTVEAGKNVTVTVTNTYTKKVTPPPAEYTLSVDIQKNIELKRSSSRKPGKASFTFEAYLVDEKGNETILDTVTIDTKGTKSADGTLTFTLTEDDLSVTGHGTVYVREVKGSTRGWTYDDTVYALGVELLDGKLNIISVDTKRIDKPATLEFTNVYYKRSTTTGGGDKPIQSVKTGDMGIAMYAMTSLLSLGGAALVIKKRKEEK